MPNFKGAFAIADKELAVFFDRALMHAEYCDFAHIRIGNNLKDMG